MLRAVAHRRSKLPRTTIDELTAGIFTCDYEQIAAREVNTVTQSSPRRRGSGVYLNVEFRERETGDTDV